MPDFYEAEAAARTARALEKIAKEFVRANRLKAIEMKMKIRIADGHSPADYADGIDDVMEN